MDLTPIISAVITLIAAVITTFLVPYLKIKVGENNFNEIKAWVNVAVSAAEMIYVGVGRGEEKKAYVVDYIESKGYKIDADSLNNLIEATVLELQKV